MEYVEISFKVPKGYEQQVTDLVMMKIEGILSQEILKPTEAKKVEFFAEVEKSYTENSIIKVATELPK